jgi:hypothetical protein
MLRRGLVATLMLTACASTMASSVSVDPRVEREVAGGRSRVLVEVRPPIARSQFEVLTRLTGTDFALVRRFDVSPLLALEIGASALTALRGMNDVVVRIVPDSAVPAARDATPRRQP